MAFNQYLALVNSLAIPVTSWLSDVHNISISVDEVVNIMIGEEVQRQAKTPVETMQVNKTSRSKNTTPKELIDSIKIPELPVPSKLVTKPQKKKETPQETPSTSSSSEGIVGCTYQFKKGENKDKYCSKKCVAGSKFCSKHKSSGDDDNDEKEKKPRKRVVKDETTDETEEVEIKEEKPKAKGKGIRQKSQKIELSNEDFDDLLSSSEIKNKLPNLISIPESEYLQVKGQNIVVKLASNKKECELIGVFDENPQDIRQPTNDELKTIMKYNININNDKPPVMKIKNELDLTQIGDIEIPDDLADDMENDLNVPNLLHDD